MEFVISHLVKSYGSKQVLKDVDFTFEEGRIYGLLGRNGSGKTTFFNCINSDIDINSGEFYFRGEGNEKIPVMPEDIGYLVSTPTVPEFMTGREFLKFFIEVHEEIKPDRTIDEYFDYKFGQLEWRSVRFEQETLDMPNYQGNAVMNFTDAETPYTRIIEHKHFEMFGDDVYKCPKTVISREYSSEWHPGIEPFYTVNDDRNNNLYKKYKELADQEQHVTFGGRLAEYKYYDIAPIIEKVMGF